MIKLTQTYQSIVSQQSYFGKLITQLNKDFNDDYFDEKSNSLQAGDTEKLELYVSEYIGQLFDQSSEAFFQIMYRIDIPEADFKTTMLASGIDFQLLTTLILKREVLKILTREHFSRIQS